MSNENYHDDIIRELSLLYELSLTFGQSLNMKENSENFVKTLVSRKNLDYGSVWVKSSLIDRHSTSEYSLVVAYPDFQTKVNHIESSHKISEILKERDYAIIDESKPEFGEVSTEKRISGGSFIILKLGRIGFVKFYCSIKNEIFTRKEVNQLKGILLRFAVTLEGSIAYKRAVEEIKERKKATNEMILVSKRFSSIVENIGKALLMTDENGKIILFNSDMESVSGFSRDEIQTIDKFKEKCLNQNKDNSLFDHSKMLDSAAEHPKNFEIELNTKESKTKDLSAEIKVLNHLNKKYLFYTFTDITELSKSKTERELQNNLLNSSGEGFLISESENPEDGLLFYNDALKNLLNLGEEKLSEMSFLSILEHDYKTGEFEALKSKIQSGEIFEIQKETGDGILCKIKIFPAEDQKGKITNYFAIVSNISEVAQLTKTADETKSRLESLYDSLPGAIVFENADARIKKYNNEFLELTGINDSAAAIDKSAVELISEIAEDKISFQNKVDEILKSRSTQKEIKLILKDGRNLKLDYIPIFNKEEYKGHFWLIKDSTVDTLEYEEESRLKAVYKKLLDILPVQAAMLDENLQYIYLNSAYEENVHIREWAIGKEDSEYCRKTGIEKPTADYRKVNFEKALADNTPACFEEKRIDRDGNRKIVSLNVIPVKEKEDKPKEIIVCGIDVSDLKRAEIEIKKMQKQLDALFESVDSAVIVFSEDGIIQSVNNSAEKLFGYPLDDFGGKELTALLDPIEKRESENVIEKFRKTPLNGAASEKLETFGININGDKFPVYIRLQQIGGNGKKIYIAVITDISENRDLSFEIESLKLKAEQILKEREEYLSELESEFETPMNAFVNMTHLLLEMEPSSEQKKLLEVLKYSSENMFDYFNDLTKSKSENDGEIEISKETFSVKKEIDEVVGSIGFAANEKKLKIETHFDQLIPQFVSGDSKKLRQILNKLALNAIKFSNKGSIRLNSYLIDEDKETAKIKFVVEDSGIGIDSNRIEAIFNSDPNSPAKFGSSKLDLPSIKQSLESMGGSISVQSRLNIGSIFVVILTFEKVPEAVKNELPKSGDDAKQKLSGKKILLVEEGQINSLILKNLLTLWGAEIITALNVKDTLKRAEDFNIDMALVDLSLPENASFKIAKELRVAGYEFPILALASKQFMKEETRAREYGMNGILNKPFKPEDLLNEILKFAAGISDSPLKTIDKAYINELSKGKKKPGNND